MVIFILFVLGLCAGSFINATAWRIHKQSKGKQTSKYSIVKGRSMCDHCGHQLAARDLVPLLSWLSLAGKCRYCHKSLSIEHPLIELFSGLMFALSYNRLAHVGVLDWFILGVWLLILTILIGLFIYDLHWMLLPNRLVWPLLVLATVELCLIAVQATSHGHQLIMGILGLLVGGGVFYVLYQISDGRWIGGGDVRLGAAMGLILGPIYAIAMIFVASSLGLVVTLPFLASKKAKLDTRIPYGPFLIIAGIIMKLFGVGLINWYKRQFLSI